MDTITPDLLGQSPYDSPRDRRLTGWTEARMARFRELYAEGLSHNAIAAALGGITRNASIGKAARMGLEPRKGAIKADRLTGVARVRKIYPRPSQARIQPCGTGWRTVETPAPQLAEGESRPAHAVGLLELRKHHCRWPYGEGPDIAFCGAHAVDKLPYCAGHARMAYHRQPTRTEQRFDARKQVLPTQTILSALELKEESAA